MAGQRFIDADTLCEQIQNMNVPIGTVSHSSDFERVIDERINRAVHTALYGFKINIAQAVKNSATASPCMLCALRPQDQLPD
jgi:hypothetical protein